MQFSNGSGHLDSCIPRLAFRVSNSTIDPQELACSVVVRECDPVLLSVEGSHIGNHSTRLVATVEEYERAVQKSGNSYRSEFT